MITRPLTAAEKLARARTQLLLNQPFFGTLCIRLKLVPEPGFPTMATNGQHIIYNPDSWTNSPRRNWRAFLRTRSSTVRWLIIVGEGSGIPDCGTKLATTP